MSSAEEATVLHVFDRVCNLVSHQGEIVSLVTDEIGPGPFSIVLPTIPQAFTQFLSQNTTIRRDGATLFLGPLTIETADTPLWDSCPNWQDLRDHQDRLHAHLPALKQVSKCRSTPFSALAKNSERRLAAGAERLRQGLENDDMVTCRLAAQDLAGLGIGLTPAGDDFLVGAIYALWLTRSTMTVAQLAGAMVSAAVPRTTSLSIAWLQAASRGEAAEPWHILITGLISDDREAVTNAINRILATGHTSGADALAGFVAVLEDSL